MKQTNLEFLQLKIDYGLTLARIAKLMGCSIETVKAYGCAPESKRYRAMPTMKLKFFKMLLTSHKLKRVDQTIKS